MSIPLKVYKCRECGHQTIVYSGFCPECRARESFVMQEIAGNGHLYAFTRVHVCEERLKGEAPYILCMVEFDGGLKAMGRLSPSLITAINIGSQVELKEIVEGEYFFRFCGSD